jgi:hypothetical protein
VSASRNSSRVKVRSRRSGLCATTSSLGAAPVICRSARSNRAQPFRSPRVISPLRRPAPSCPPPHRRDQPRFCGGWCGRGRRRIGVLPKSRNKISAAFGGGLPQGASWRRLREGCHDVRLGDSASPRLVDGANNPSTGTAHDARHEPSRLVRRRSSIVAPPPVALLLFKLRMDRTKRLSPSSARRSLFRNRSV